jgi:hypothetical protein
VLVSRCKNGWRSTLKWLASVKGSVRGHLHELRAQARSSVQRLGSALVRRISASILAKFGASLADVRPLGWYAGWKFGAAEFDAGRLGRLRFSLWSVFEERRLKKPFTIRWYDGLRINVYLGNDLSRCLYAGGAYEPNEFMFLSQALQPGMTFIDVGANDGLYTLLLQNP